MNNLVLLDVWRSNFIRKNIGLHLNDLVNVSNKIFVYCNHADSNYGGIEFIASRISKKASSVLFVKRSFSIFYILWKKKIDVVSWAYISDQELYAICLYKFLFKKSLVVRVKTDSEDVTNMKLFKSLNFLLSNIDTLYTESVDLQQLYRNRLNNVEVRLMYNPSFLEQKMVKMSSSMCFTGQLIFAGRVAKNKQLIELLELFEWFASRHRSASLKLLLLLDDEEYFLKFNEAFLNLKKLGYKISMIIDPNSDQMAEVYRHSELMLYTSYLEGVPNVISDAYYSYVPVLALDAGNMSSIVSPELLCDNLDKMKFVLNNLITSPGFYEDQVSLVHDFYERNMSMRVFRDILL